MPSTTEPFQCRHLFTDGRRCGSPALREEAFCYHHHATRRFHPRQRALAGQAALPGETTVLPADTDSFDLPHPEDRHATQCAIGHILQRIAANRIDPRRAAALLYGLSIASANLPRPRPVKPADQPDRLLDPETEVVDDPELGTLAVPGSPLKPERHLSSLNQYLLGEEREKRIKAEQDLAAAIALYPDLAPPPPPCPIYETPGRWQNGVFVPSSTMGLPNNGVPR